ncbi:uncharacterized protein CLUP02_12988 [Colletotrichum lupini]|uniref:Uncharacterized protein n=1 Tax=Colletotrichum lupini TaxID=145971 RepID=A0A9Q8T242_9PEZI|nr:uncharacterized protein CLUP02_12988 [Colletotrichum lupini]UQC87483.1 hypothetical protein CLUP02_12988 [Colletotrichum lupini]
MLNTLIAGIIKISFGLSKEIVTLSTIEIKTYFRTITFYILLINTLFLLYLKDIDRLGIIFNNIKNRIFSNKHFEIVERQQGHIFIKLTNNIKLINYLTKSKLKRLY